MSLYFNLPAVFFIAMVVVCVFAFGTLAKIWERARAHGWRLLEGDRPAADPGSLHTFLLASATILGGLWAVCSIVETGSYEFERLKFEQARQHETPHLEIELHTELLSPESLAGGSLVPLHVRVTVRNPGQQEVLLDLDKVPLLSLASVRVYPGKDTAGFDQQIINLPYIKIVCLDQHQCETERWTQATLEPGGVGYYTFLHPGLPAGIYYVQFQLPVPENLRKLTGSGGPRQPGVWTRSTYVEVRLPPALVHRADVAASGGPPEAARLDGYHW